MRILVYIVFRWPVVAFGLARILGDAGDFDVVGEAASAPSALSGVLATNPDVVVVEESPDASETNVVERLSSLGSRSKIVVLSEHRDPGSVAHAIRAGAHGYIYKSESLREIATVLRRCVSEGGAVSRAVEDVLVDALRAPALGELDTLSERETEVALLIGQGLTTADIGARLGISPRTVETLRRRVRRKTGCTSDVELTRALLRRQRVAR